METLSPQEFKEMHEAGDLKEVSAEAKSADPQLESKKIFEYIDHYDRKQNPVMVQTEIKPLEELQRIEQLQIADLESTRYQIALYGKQ